MVENPIASGIINKNTLLIAINLGPNSGVIISPDELPGAILMDSTPYDLYNKGIPLYKTLFGKIFPEYESIEVAGKGTYGLDAPGQERSTLLFYQDSGCKDQA